MGNVSTQKKTGKTRKETCAAAPGAALRRRRLYEVMSKSALRHRRLYEQMYAVPAAAGHSFGVGCLHPVLDGEQEPLEAKVREGRHTLV